MVIYVNTIKRLATLATLALATPARASCERPPVPFTDADIRKNPAIATSWMNITDGQIARCRQAEADKADAQEREDIHTIDLRLRKSPAG